VVRVAKFFAVTMTLAAVALLTESCARPRPKKVEPLPVAKPPRVTELRGVWVSNTDRLDWDSATANLQRAGFNTMYVNFASAGGAFYPNSRALPNISGGSTDAIARGIELAHRRGIAVHAKIIVMFMFKAPPDWQKQMLEADRIMRGSDGRPALQAGFAWLCPSRAENRALMASAVSEILTRYGVDGVQFDYIRFYEQPTCFCANCKREFERAMGISVSRWPADVLTGQHAARFNEWRRHLITNWARELAVVARRTRPGIYVSAAVFQDLDEARERKMQDWRLWLERGYIDYACTMTYVTDLREFQSRLRKQQAWAPRKNQIVVGIGSWKFDSMSQLSAQIDAVRRLNAPGFVLFSYDDAAARNFLPKL
jgi:uncharacterized lipoprotein YddW (UPF0748 family)